MATLTVVSDLHLEARPLSLDDILDPELVSDVLCLLGDIGDPTSQTYRDFLASCAARFPTVLLLAGNNEFRNHDGGGRTMAQTEGVIRAAASAHPNVHFLQNTTHVLGDVAFIGTTLWSYLPDTPLPPPSEDTVSTGGDSHTAGATAAAAGESAAAAVVITKSLVSLTTMPQTLEPSVALPTAVLTETFPGVGGLQAQTGVASQRISVSIITPVSASASASPAVTAEENRVVISPYTPSTGSKQSGSKQSRSKQQHLPGPPFTQPPNLPALPSAQKLRPLILEGLRKLGLPVPIPFPRQSWINRSAALATAAGGGDGSVVAVPRTGTAAGAAGGIMAPPRFVSHSQPPPDWLMSRGFGASQACGLDAGGSGAGCEKGCGAGCGGLDSNHRPCRRRHQLRHCVSLASLRPDEPCPSWRAIQAKCVGASSSSSSGSNSSESDALGSDSDSSQSSYGSDVERSDTSPFNTATDGGRALYVAEEFRAQRAEAQDQTTIVWGLGTAGKKAPVAGATAATASSPINVDYPLIRIIEKQQLAPRDTVGGLSTSEPRTTLGGGGDPAGSLPAIRVLSQPVSSFGIATDVPTFLSDRGTVSKINSYEKMWECAAPAGDAGAIASASAASAVATANVGGAPSASASLSTVAYVVDAATASSPNARSGNHYHNHFHHHHRHSSHSSSHPPPVTIRAFIGATSLDYRRIFNSPDGPAITPDITNELFLSSLEYVRSAVAAAREQGLMPIVLSHHAPSMRGTSRPTFEGHPSTHAYSTDLEPYLATSGITAWYCGHTHFNFDMQLPGGVRLASNQFGSQPKPADGYSRTWQHPLPATTTAATASTTAVSVGRMVKSSTTATRAALPPSFPAEALNGKGLIVKDCSNFRTSAAYTMSVPLLAAAVTTTVGPVGFGAPSSVQSTIAY